MRDWWRPAWWRCSTETKTVNETLAVQARLDEVQLRIETDRGRLDNLTRVTDYATIA